MKQTRNSERAQTCILHYAEPTSYGQIVFGEIFYNHVPSFFNETSKKTGSSIFLDAKRCILELCEKLTIHEWEKGNTL